MAKRLLTLCLVFFIAHGLNAQSFSVAGTVKDQQTKTPLTGATVQLKSLSNAATQKTISDSTGAFRFFNLSKSSFLLSLSFVGYNPVSRKIQVDSTDINIDIAAVTSTSSELETVVMRTAISPVPQKADTIQINASQYKVNPDATGEDLVKKM